MSYHLRPVCFCKIDAPLVLVAVERANQDKDKLMKVSEKQREVGNATSEMPPSGLL